MPATDGPLPAKWEFSSTADAAETQRAAPTGDEEVRGHNKDDECDMLTHHDKHLFSQTGKDGTCTHVFHTIVGTLSA